VTSLLGGGSRSLKSELGELAGKTLRPSETFILRGGSPGKKWSLGKGFTTTLAELPETRYFLILFDEEILASFELLTESPELVLVSIVDFIVLHIDDIDNIGLFLKAGLELADVNVFRVELLGEGIGGGEVVGGGEIANRPLAMTEHRALFP